MNSSQKIKRVQLNVNDQEKPVILGLVSSDPDYKLSIKINGKLRLKLKSSLPLITEDNDISFSMFSDQESADSAIYLVSNRAGKNFLLRQLKNIDFIFLIHGESKAGNIDEISSQLRVIDTITAVFIIGSDILKDKNLKYLP